MDVPKEFEILSTGQILAEQENVYETGLKRVHDHIGILGTANRQLQVFKDVPTEVERQWVCISNEKI
jgi:hypothetical protein